SPYPWLFLQANAGISARVKVAKNPNSESVPEPSYPSRPGSPLQPRGGCQPARTQQARTIKASSSSSRCNAATVARPTGVLPMIRSPSEDQRKWSTQTWNRGLNNGVSSPVNGSFGWVRSALYRLQSGQLNQRLDSASAPPLAFGVICSISRRAITRCWGL